MKIKSLTFSKSLNNNFAKPISLLNILLSSVLHGAVRLTRKTHRNARQADERRKVMFLIPTLAGGGAERVIITLLRHLDRSKFRLVLVVVNLTKEVFLDKVPDDVELVDLGCSRVRYAMHKIACLAWILRPNVIFSTLGHLNLALAIMRPFLPFGVRFIARETVVVTENIRVNKFPAIWRWAYRRFYNRFDTVVCQSSDMRNDLIEGFALSPDNAVIIHNPVDMELISRMAAEPIVTGLEPVDAESGCIVTNLVAAGRLTYQKGMDIIIEALSLCRNPHLRLTILGEGPLRSDLERLAEQTGVLRQVRFVGFQKNPYPFFAEADAFVLGSRYEGLPNVVLEALACGTTVIATPAPGGVKELLEDVDGCVVVHSISAHALSQAFQYLSTGRRVSVKIPHKFRLEEIIGRYEEELDEHAPI